MSVRDDLRYEIKIPLEGFPVFEIRRWVNLHPFGFRKTYPTRRVNNLYFDTIDFSDFQAHLDGYFDRKKIRLRWYGINTAFSNSNFEIKSKFGNLGNKNVFFITKAFNFSTDTHKEIIQKILDQIPEDLAILISNYQPVVINYYQREYFESVREGVRLTIDYGHHTFDQRYSKKPNISFSEPFHNSPIIEIKAPKGKYKVISEILALLPANPNRFSKYMDGMLSILSR
jgi:hypothetical protein